MRQLRDKELNYFAEFFDIPSVVLGVPVACAPDCPQNALDGEWLDAASARAVGASGSAPPARIILQPYHGLDRIHPGRPREWRPFLRDVYRAIGPEPRLAAQIDSWIDENLEAAYVVAVNVRTGNGHYFGKGQPYEARMDTSIFDDADELVRILGRACQEQARRAPRRHAGPFRTFYATDSPLMSEALAGLPNAVTRRRRFPPPGEGDLYGFDDEGDADRESVADTIVDMFLLARCDAMIYNSSNFNQYARVVTDEFGGNSVHIDTLFLRRRLRGRAVVVKQRLRARLQHIR
jgi:hypothetical protein